MACPSIAAAVCINMSGGVSVGKSNHDAHQDRSNNNATAALIYIGGSIILTAIPVLYYANRIRRSRWLAEEDRVHGHDETTHSVIDHFKSLILDPETSVEEANQKRTMSYYLKMRESHSKSLVLGISPCSWLEKLRKKEMDRALHYWQKGNQSHRTIVAMCDDTTRTVLADARRRILEPLEHSSDIGTRGVWIPPLNIIPDQGKFVVLFVRLVCIFLHLIVFCVR